jgi:hypothetical protein
MEEFKERRGSISAKEMVTRHFATSKKFKIITIVIIVLYLSVANFVIPTVYNNHENEYTGTVTWKERIQYGMLWWSTSAYLIYTVDEYGVPRVFKNTDTTLRSKFNSSDLYALINIGETYRFKAVGFRDHVFFDYENIIEFEKVEGDTET